MAVMALHMIWCGIDAKMTTLARVWTKDCSFGLSKRSRIDFLLSVAGVGVGFFGRLAEASGEATTSKSSFSFDGRIDILIDDGMLCIVICEIESNDNTKVTSMINDGVTFAFVQLRKMPALHLLY